MTDIKNANSHKYNNSLAMALKEEGSFEPPEWIEFVKSGSGKVRPIEEQDFWYKRAASILRQIYVNEVVGVQRLRTRYGNRKNRGNQPEKFKRGAGKIIRLILQQAEKAGLVEKSNDKRKGRKLTAAGKKFLEEIEVK